MDDKETQQSKELFCNAVNQLELEYSYYLCLHSIQKGLTSIESLYDHFDLDPDNMELCFKPDSDLPEALRKVIRGAYQQVYSGLKKV